MTLCRDWQGLDISVDHHWRKTGFSMQPASLLPFQLTAAAAAGLPCSSWSVQQQQRQERRRLLLTTRLCQLTWAMIVHNVPNRSWGAWTTPAPRSPSACHQWTTCSTASLALGTGTGRGTAHLFYRAAEELALRCASPAFMAIWGGFSQDSSCNVLT